MKSALPIILFLAFGVGCREVDRTIGMVDDSLLGQLDAYRELYATNQVQLADPDEPGQRLLLLGRLVSKESGEVLPDRRILFYHTNAAGSYDEAVPGDETTARIRGSVRTDSRGRFLVSTILPGGYGTTTDGGHIHLTVHGAQPEAYDFFFRQYVSRGLARWARRSDQAVLIDLMLTPGDTLLAAIDLPVKGL